jgi:hypothetical protein
MTNGLLCDHEYPERHARQGNMGSIEAECNEYKIRK